MADGLSLVEWLDQPLTKAVGASALLGGLLHIPIIVGVWSALWATSGQLFGMLGMFSFVAPHIDFIPESWVVGPMLVVGLIALVKSARNWLQKFIDKIRNNS